MKIVFAWCLLCGEVRALALLGVLFVNAPKCCECRIFWHAKASPPSQPPPQSQSLGYRTWHRSIHDILPILTYSEVMMRKRMEGRFYSRVRHFCFSKNTDDSLRARRAWTTGGSLCPLYGVCKYLMQSGIYKFPWSMKPLVVGSCCKFRN